MKELSISAFWAIGSELLGVGLPIIVAMFAVIAIATVAALIRFGARLEAGDWIKAALVGIVVGIGALLVALMATSASLTDLKVSTDYLAAAAFVIGVGAGVTAMIGAVLGARQSRLSLTS
jgi:uncharacterized membrane protein